MAKKAYAMGVNTEGLLYAKNDAGLIDQALRLHGYLIVTPKSESTKREILEQLDDITDNCNKADTLLFYFSGHGQIIRGRLYLKINDKEGINKSFIFIRDITDAIENCRASNKLVILDCCHSGNKSQDWNIDEPGESYRLLTSSKRLERSKEFDDLQASFLTYSIHQALTTIPNEILDARKKITVNKLYDWLKVQANLYNSKDNSDKASIPNLFGNQDSNIEIATVEGKISTSSKEERQEDGSKLAHFKPKRISISRLPVTHSKIFGREKELELINESWKDKDTNILVVVAWGGVGKTALINSWIGLFAKNGYDDAEVVYAWSFYNQGTTDRVVSSDLFLEAALTYFGDENPSKGTSWEKGERLAQLTRKQRTLLILDGLEPLQHPPGSQGGKLKDNAIKALLKELASQNNGLCLLTTRLQVTDIDSFKDFTVKYLNLKDLDPKAGAQLLREQGVKGDEKELQRASEKFRGHSLTLTLLGSYISDVYYGDIKFLEKVTTLKSDTSLGGHASRIMSAYETWFGERCETSLLKVLGLFDRPVSVEIVNVLKAPPIEGLTDSLFRQTEEEWREMLAILRRIGLLYKRDSNNPDILDLHPLVREHFGEQLRSKQHTTWLEANARLFDYYKTIAKELPATIEEMEPLFLAVIFGCKAKKYKEALHEVYFPRIMRGDKFYASIKLGALGTLLYILSHFFEHGNWITLYDGIDESDGFLIYREVGQYLTSTRGYADPDVGKCYTIARKLCDKLNHQEYTFEVLLGQIKYYRMHGQLDISGKVAHEMLDLCDEKNVKYKVFAYRAVATNFYYTGDFARSKYYAELGVVQYDNPDEALRNAQFDVNEPSISCLGYVGLNSWFLGEPNKAKSISRETVVQSENLGHKHTLVVAIYIDTLVDQYSRNSVGTQQLAKKLIDLSSEYGFALWRIAGEMLYGWSMDHEESIRQIENGLMDWEATGARLFSPYWRALLAERYLYFGYYKEAFSQADIGLSMANKNNDRHWEAELYRIKAEALAAQNENDEAEAIIQKAIATAQRQMAISLELRSAISAFRISKTMASRINFKDLVQNLYSKFNDGFDTYDLVQARALLGESSDIS